MRYHKIAAEALIIPLEFAMSSEKNVPPLRPPSHLIVNSQRMTRTQSSIASSLLDQRCVTRVDLAIPSLWVYTSCNGEEKRSLHYSTNHETLPAL